MLSLSNHYAAICQITLSVSIHHSIHDMYTDLQFHHRIDILQDWCLWLVHFCRAPKCCWSCVKKKPLTFEWLQTILQTRVSSKTTIPHVWLIWLQDMTYRALLNSWVEASSNCQNFLNKHVWIRIPFR